MKGSRFPLRAVVASIVVLLVAGVARAERSAIDGVEIARLLGFDEDALKRVKAGELIARRSNETSDKELALVVWGWTRKPVAALFEVLRAEDVLRVDRQVIAYAEIDAGAVAPSFSTLVLDAGSIEELRRTSSQGPINLSHEELQTIETARTRNNKERSDAVVDTYRQILTERTLAYLAGGINAIAPYAREHLKTEPAGELRSATAGYQVLRSHVPGLHRAWAEFPRATTRADPGWKLTHRFFWILQTIEGLPTVVLSHSMVGLRDGLAFAMERQFYVGRSYNALETVWGGVTAEQGSFVYYHNRTSTDQVAGTGGAFKKSIGRRMMKNEVLDFLESLRAAFE